MDPSNPLRQRRPARRVSAPTKYRPVSVSTSDPLNPSPKSTNVPASRGHPRWIPRNCRDAQRTSRCRHEHAYGSRPVQYPDTGGMAHNACMSLAVVAAFTAAFLSLVNVAVSARLTRRGSLEQWRREQLQPIVARMLTLSGDLDQARTAFINTNLSIRLARPDGSEVVDLEQEARTQMGRVYELFRNMEYQQTLLDLLAGRHLREIANKFVEDNSRLNTHVSSDKGYSQEIGRPLLNDLYLLQKELIESTRADFRIRSLRGPRSPEELESSIWRRSR